MNARNKRIIVIVLVTFILEIVMCSQSFCFTVNDLTGTKLNDVGAQDFGNMIITVLTVVGTVISVIALIVLGLKYMMGSVEEKAEYKKTLLPYVIGTFLVFCASVLAGIIYNLAINLG